MIPVTQEQIDVYTNNGWWGNETILDILWKNAAQTPDSESVVDPYNRPDLVGGEAKRLTYRQLVESIDRLAFQLDQLGIRKDDILLVQLPNVVDAIVTYLAVARIGAIPSPLAMAARSRELTHAIKLTDAVGVITVKEFGGFDHLKLVNDLKAKNRHFEHVILAGTKLDNSAHSLETMMSDDPGTADWKDRLTGKEPGPNDIFTICWTSGTEADPKGVPRTHNHWISIAKLVVEGVLLKNGHNIHGTFPVINMAGFGGLMIPWVMTGGKFVLHHPFDVQVFMGQLMKEDLYYTLMPPALLDTLAKTDQAKALAKTSIGAIASGSVPLSPWMVKYYQDELGISIVNFFASNEGIGLFSGPRLFPEAEDRAQYFPRFGGEGAVLNISQEVIGGLQSCLLSTETGEEIRETGVVGELCFKGPTIFSGYWQRDDLTKNAFSREGYYQSGDLFSIEGEKQDKYLFHGRCKDLIIRGGYNISPEEVENVISGHPKIKEACAVGYPDERLGEKTCICVVPVADETVTLEEITGYLDEQGIAKYKYPERLEIMAALPRNALDKVLRRELRRKFMEQG
ncbi:MAG: class I adenylate-forming enzyme family protein [bacterium]